MPGLEPGDAAVSAAALTSVAQERLSLVGSWNKLRRFLFWAHACSMRLQRSAIPRSGDGASHAAAILTIAVDVHKQNISAGVEADAGKFSVIQAVDRRLEWPPIGRKADQPVYIANIWRQRMAVPVARIRVVLTDEKPASRAGSDVVG